MINQKIKLKEKIGYGFGDAASSMFWKLFSMYLLYFYTDIFGIPAAVVGTMFLITRVWDAINDPIMGVISDRTKSRFGKFRPYLLWVAIPFGIIGVLTFTTPNMDVKGKIVYAYVTYTLMMMVYTAINVPYASLLGVMTADGKERTTLASFRMVFAFGGSILVLATFQPLFDTFGSKEINKFDTLAKPVKGQTDADFSKVDVINGEISSTDKIDDSLLVLSARIKTTSDEALKIGVYSVTQQQYYWSEIPAGKDTLGLRRDGTWNNVKLKLKKLTGGLSLSVLQPLKLAISANDPSDFKIKKANLSEVNYRGGTQKAVIIISLVAIILFFFTFSWTKERVKPILEKQSSVKNDLKDLLKNGPWFVLLGAGVSALIFNSIRDGVAVYYFKYFIQKEDAVELTIFGIIFPIAYSTIYLVLGQAANIVGVILAKPISDKIGKRQTFLWAMIIATVFSLMFYSFDRSAIALIFIFQFLISISAGIIFPLLWSMYADIADYSEWKTGRRATGLVFSSSSMSQKFGWTLGTAVTGWLLAYYGFKANVVQSIETQHAIRMMLSFYPAIGTVLSVIFIYIYPLSEHKMERVSAELAERRNQK